MDHPFETERWPFVQAKYFRRVGERPVRVIVIHDMEFPEEEKTAKKVADYFTHPDTPSSAHICVDSDSIVQCVLDRDVAYGAPGANQDGIQIELAGFGSQTREQWLDSYSKRLLERAADATAQYCLKYDIPPRQLTNAQLADKKSKGLVGHRQVSEVFKKSTHTDPGPNFPWDVFLTLVQQALARRANEVGKVTTPFVADADEPAPG